MEQVIFATTGLIVFSHLSAPTVVTCMLIYGKKKGDAAIAMQTIVEDAKAPVRFLGTDSGTEFTVRKFEALMRLENIQHRLTDPKNHAPLAPADLLRIIGFEVEKGQVQLLPLTTTEIKNASKTLAEATTEVDTPDDLDQRFTKAIGSVESLTVLPELSGDQIIFGGKHNVSGNARNASCG